MELNISPLLLSKTYLFKPALHSELLLIDWLIGGFCFVFLDKLSLCSSRCLGTHRDWSASVFQECMNQPQWTLIAGCIKENGTVRIPSSERIRSHHPSCWALEALEGKGGQLTPLGHAIGKEHWIWVRTQPHPAHQFCTQWGIGNPRAHLHTNTNPWPQEKY